MVTLAAVLIGAVLMALALRSRLKRLGRGVVIVIPFRSPSIPDERARNLAWLVRYWKEQLPCAELIIGDDPDTCRPFSKSVAINRAVAQSHGDVLVLVDADGYMPAESVMHCVDEIRHARRRGFKLWFVPYRKFYRLTNEATMHLLRSDPKNPHTLPDNLEEYTVKGTDPYVAHWHGALIQILPREAFDVVGGWDERFRGWGGEDNAAMRATDTLYWSHKTLPTRVMHLWHPMLSKDGSAEQVHWKERMWEGQEGPVVNSQLCSRYYQAYGRPKIMRRLVDEWIQLKREGLLDPAPHHSRPPCDHDPPHSI